MTALLRLQPVAVMVSMIFTVPAVTPVTTPVVEPTVAMAVDELLQVTPPLPVSVIPDPTHTDEAPLMEGRPLTVTTAVALQPAPIEYVTVANPGETPLTNPPPVIVAVVVGVMLHVPPVVASLSAVVLPWHTWSTPAMGDGDELTVTVAVV